MNEEQTDLLKSAIQFSGTTASNVMTAREQILAIDVSTPPAEVLSVIRASNHSRLPVYEGDIDHIVGYLQIRTFMREYLKGSGVSVRDLLIPAFFVRPDALIDDLLTVMRQHRFYMAVVSEEDEDGCTRTRGIVTIEDFLEELVGDIWDESDVIDKTFSKLGGGRYRVDTHVTVGEAFARMNCPPPEMRVGKMPVMAWIIETFRHIPAEGESFTYRNLEITVDEVEGHRVSYVIIQIDTDQPKPVSEGISVSDGDPARADALSDAEKDGETRDSGKEAVRA